MFCTALAPRLIQSISWDVSLLSVPSIGDRNRMDWKLLVKKHVTCETRIFYFAIFLDSYGNEPTILIKLLSFLLKKEEGKKLAFHTLLPCFEMSKPTTKTITFCNFLTQN